MEVKYGIRLYKVEIYYQMFFIHFTILGRTLERLADTWQTLHGRCGSVSGLPWTRIAVFIYFILRITQISSSFAVSTIVCRK